MYAVRCDGLVCICTLQSLNVPGSRELDPVTLLQMQFDREKTTFIAKFLMTVIVPREAL